MNMADNVGGSSQPPQSSKKSALFPFRPCMRCFDRLVKSPEEVLQGGPCEFREGKDVCTYCVKQKRVAKCFEVREIEGAGVDSFADF